MGIQTLRTSTVGVYGFLFFSQMSAYRLQIFIAFKGVLVGAIDHWIPGSLNGYKKGRVMPLAR